MNKEFIESLGLIRSESIGMIKNLKAVRGENYARVVHSIILADQMDMINDVALSAVHEETREGMTIALNAQMQMVALIMKYFFKSTQFSDEQIEQAFADAERIQKNTESLIQQAKVMADNGQVMGE